MSKKLLTILVAYGLVSTGALANDVYVDQIGDNAIISITQIGAGNRVNGNIGGTGNVDDAAIIKGNLNNVTITQLGVGNLLSMVVNNETNGGGATIVASADGSSNTQTIGCGTALSSTCNANIIKSEITGNSNNTVQMLNGGVVKSTIFIDGDWNNVTHTATGAGLHVGEITVLGSGANGAASVVMLAQSGALTKNAVINSNGSNNNISVTQSD